MLKRIKLLHFRNFERREFLFEAGMNHIIGENGMGKTNLLEAICLLSTGRSFRTANLKELIQQGKKSFMVEATFVKDEVEQTLSLYFDGKERKIKHNATPYQGFVHLLGLLPSIVYSPSDLELIEGAPKFRRRFLNLHIAQGDSLYAHHLARYAKALLHRNSLLKKRTTKTIEIWEGELAKSAEYLIQKRGEALTHLSLLIKELYPELCAKNEIPEIRYQPSPWKPQLDKELFLGHTLNGPHKDDFHICLNGSPARSFASEGQKRTLIASLKLSETRRLDNPLFAIDDFGSHLDNSRQGLLLKRIEGLQQIFLTSPNRLTQLLQPLEILI